MADVERTDYAALRAHLDAGRPWLDPMTWLLVDEAEVEMGAVRQRLDGAVSLLRSLIDRDEAGRCWLIDDAGPTAGRISDWLDALGRPYSAASSGERRDA